MEIDTGGSELLTDEQAGIYSAQLGRNWRVLYEIDEIDEIEHAVIVLDIRPRSSAYRSTLSDPAHTPITTATA